MANKENLGDFYTSNNQLGVSSTMIFGNSSVNVSINASSIVISPTTSLTANGGLGTAGQALTSNGSAVYWSTIVGTNTAAAYTWTNTHVFQANVTANSLIINSWLSANGSNGTAGMVLTSAGGSNVYWSSAGVNTAAQYTWTNVHTFNANVTFGNSSVNATAFTNSSGVFLTGNVVGIGNTTYFVSNGNVGIGNTTPNLKLEVAGNMSVDAFIENTINVATSYTITTGRNAMSAGPITINSGVTVTVPSGSTWTIV